MLDSLLLMKENCNNASKHALAKFSLKHMVPVSSPDMAIKHHHAEQQQHTVDVEKFAGLNICGFNSTEVLVEIISARSAYYLRVALLFMEKPLQCS